MGGKGGGGVQYIPAQPSAPLPVPETPKITDEEVVNEVDAAQEQRARANSVSSHNQTQGRFMNKDPLSLGQEDKKVKAPSLLGGV